MSEEKEQAELVEFEIVRGSEETVHSLVEPVQLASPWQMARFVLLGLVGLALLFIVLGLGVILLIPVLVFIMISKLIGSILSTGSPRR